MKLPARAVEEIRSALPGIADDVVAAIIAEVPSYTDAFAGPMGETIRTAVRVALGGFLSLVSERRRGSGDDAAAPTAAAVGGAYQLGQGEARSGRSTDALLSAYRIGARVSWRQMSSRGIHAGLDSRTMSDFAELVFAYIDELSAASVAGHTDELATTGRERARHLERLSNLLLTGASTERVQGAVEQAEWTTPRTLTAVIVPEALMRSVLSAVSVHTLQAADPPGLEEGVALLVPDAHGRRRSALLRAVSGRQATVGPPRPWAEVRTSYERALRARALGLEGDTERHLPELVLRADADALADLGARALAPLDDVRPATAERLAETLRAWLLLQGRRDDVAAALFVHPQTVRYRMGQLRELYGDRLDDPDEVLSLVIGLSAPAPGAGTTSSPK